MANGGKTLQEAVNTHHGFSYPSQHYCRGQCSASRSRICKYGTCLADGMRRHPGWFIHFSAYKIAIDNLMLIIQVYYGRKGNEKYNIWVCLSIFACSVFFKTLETETDETSSIVAASVFIYLIQ
jgi:hypothetical protein